MFEKDEETEEHAMTIIELTRIDKRMNNIDQEEAGIQWIESMMKKMK